MTKLCLNMIVKNEGARIIRALTSVAPHISYYAIYDTGSTDDTIEKIKTFFDERDIPGFVFSGEFKNFSHARNSAIDIAVRNRRYDAVNFDYLLFVDADMELVADPGAFKNLTGPSYDIIQKSGGLSYHNCRLMNADATGRYVGATHEFLNVPSAGTITDAYFIDHADGSNRVNKFERDIQLLHDDLAKDPVNPRTWFYLAQSYRDAGNPKQAEIAYKKRIDVGGWDEETWNAMVNYATCQLDQGVETGFVFNMLEAYNFRPQRAEALYDLAKFYRERGKNDLSLLYSERGLSTPRPADRLFVNDYVYRTGLREEFSICAFYNEKKRQRGFEVCNELALDPAGTDHSRAQARANLYFYLKPLTSYMNVEIRNIKPPAGMPEGNVVMNPSIANCKDGKLRAILRTVNYRITPDGRYEIKGGDGSITGSNPINTTNFLVEFDKRLKPVSSKEITWARPPAQFDLVVGMEDMRLFEHEGRLMASANVREQNANGACQQALFRLGEPDCSVVSWQILSPDTATEKNWMPIVRQACGTTSQKFFYRLDTIFDTNARTVEKHSIPQAAQHISGGSQAIPFGDGYLAVVHEAMNKPGQSARIYYHRFAQFDRYYHLQHLSMPFFFEANQIEFCAGIAWHPDNEHLVMSYGVRDEEARLATVDMLDVLNMVQKR